MEFVNYIWSFFFFNLNKKQKTRQQTTKTRQQNNRTMFQLVPIQQGKTNQVAKVQLHNIIIIVTVVWHAQKHPALSFLTWVRAEAVSPEGTPVLLLWWNSSRVELTAVVEKDAEGGWSSRSYHSDCLSFILMLSLADTLAALWMPLIVAR